MNKLKTYSWLFLINVVVFAALFLLVEFANYFLNPFNYESNRITCKYDWVLYGYCPNILDVKRNAKADGGDFVFTYTNNLGRRVADNNEAGATSPKHIFIGDSFLQAEEVAFEETFFGRLGVRYDVIAFGYSSWNIIQYRQAIEKLAVTGTHYHVFLMPNDVTPMYARSVFADRRSGMTLAEDTSIPSGFDVEFDKAYENSVLKKIISILSFNEGSSGSDESNGLPLMKTDSFTLGNANDCAPLNNLPKAYKEQLGYDYLVYAKAPACWGEKHMKAAEEAVLELQQLQDAVSRLESNLTFYVIPPGWSFENQNTKGRKGNKYYYFDNEMMVTTEPLRQFLASMLPTVRFVSLEHMFAGWLRECLTCSDIYYFPYDGHWTAEAHRKLAEYFAGEGGFR